MTGTSRLLILIAVPLIALGQADLRASSAPAEQDCLAKPNAATPPGSHWYFHLDPATQTKCWHLRSGTQGVEQPVVAPTTPQAKASLPSSEQTSPTARQLRPMQNAEGVGTAPAGAQGQPAQAANRLQPVPWIDVPASPFAQSTSGAGKLVWPPAASDSGAAPSPNAPWLSGFGEAASPSVPARGSFPSTLPDQEGMSRAAPPPASTAEAAPPPVASPADSGARPPSSTDGAGSTAAQPTATGAAEPPQADTIAKKRVNVRADVTAARRRSELSNQGWTNKRFNTLPETAALYDYMTVGTLAALAVGLVITALFLRRVGRRVVALWIAREQTFRSAWMESARRAGPANDPAMLRFLSHPRTLSSERV
jgi:hypothetical protein